MSENQSGDCLLNVSHINREFRRVAEVNAWQEYHNPKNLAAAISVEAGELLAEFQWLTLAEAAQLTAPQKARAADELADIIMYVTEMAARLDLNLADAVATKIQKNKLRFSGI